MHPKLFQIGGFVQHAYGVLVAVAFLVGLLVAVRLARRVGLDADRVFNLGVYVALAAFLGAKVLLIFSDWDYYRHNPGDIFSLYSLKAGGVFYGGFLAALLFAAWYTWRYHLPYLKTADAFAPGVALGHAIGRLGCFCSGCCWGKPTALPWGVTFTDPYAHEMFGVPLGVPLHPTQLYEALAEALIFTVLMWRWKKKAFDGQIVALYLALYGAARFAIEFVRDDPDRGFLFSGLLSTSQFIALLMLALATVIWWRKHASAAPRVQPARRPT
jgi:phosphatidylglycerol:prolipoprotein diacylglycerol transferase